MSRGYVAPESWLERRHFLVFGVLVAAGVALSTAGVKSPQALAPAQRVGVAVTAPLSRLGSGVSNTASDGWSGLSATWSAARDLDAARTELRDLRVLVADRAELKAENQRLQRILDLAQRLDMRTIPARILSRQAAPDCIFLIDRGTSSGVREDVSVISPEGVVGKVLAVTENDAKVQCFTDPDAGLAALVGDARNQIDAVVKSAGPASCRLQYVSPGVQIRPGDRVVTSGLDHVHPKGLLVGSVTSVAGEVEGMSEILVEPAVDFSRLEEVLVLIPDQPNTLPRETAVTDAVARIPPPAPESRGVGKTAGKPGPKAPVKPTEKPAGSTGPAGGRT